MRLSKARIRMYRSIRDTGEFEVENGKTILVGPNEAGKTVILQALQQLHAPPGIEGFDPLRDYPRSEYNKDIGRGAVDPSQVTVVEGHFKLHRRGLRGSGGARRSIEKRGRLIVGAEQVLDPRAPQPLRRRRSEC